MALYTTDSKERVRDAVDMADLVGTRVELRRSGPTRLEGLCPFHEERTPSFGIDPTEKVYHCFGCGAGGDVFAFVMATEGLDFGAALESLAERYRVPLERDGKGLNLTEQVRDGILNHTGSERPISLEGRLVRLVDRVAYINHDIDDALRAGIIVADDLPAAEIELLGPTGARRIDTLATDIVERSLEAGDIVQSDEVGGAMLRLRKFMFERVYLGAEARSEHERVHRTLRGLFDHYSAHPDEVPDSAAGGDEIQRITDYIAGMTDRFCIATFRRLALPEESKL